MDALLLPSRFEGLPLALMEAQCAGLPCLVSDAVTKEAAVTELVTSLPLGNAEKWAVRLADMTQSAERRGRSGQVAAAGFDRRRTKEIAALYDQLMTEKPGGRE